MNSMVQILMAAIGTLGFSVLFNLRGWKLVLAVLGGTLSWILCVLLEPLIPGEPVRWFISAMFVALWAELLAPVMKTPATTFLIPGIIPHIPGGALYNTMRLALERQWSAALSKGFYTLRLALSLALGMIVILSLWTVMHRLLAHRHFRHSMKKETCP